MGKADEGRQISRARIPVWSLQLFYQSPSIGDNDVGVLHQHVLYVVPVAQMYIQRMFGNGERSSFTAN